ncbi:unnamed protein product [Adineta ricciae]|uniref:Uncharacterized protein n=1 Tax=Adineta ricciae TaxID=249248 RepID=A0A815IRV3_ADIRI|nr:unnamed protein product [Adineta ricciae]
MRRQLIVSWLLSFAITVDGGIVNCSAFENIIYQVTTAFPDFKPYFMLLTLLSGGVFFEETNIQNGQSSAELGVRLEFGTRTGYYECIDENTIELTDFGYIFRISKLPALGGNDAFIIQTYHFYFQNTSYDKCTGYIQSAYFTPGQDPFDTQNIPIYTEADRNLTCELLSGRHYRWPPNT